MFKQKQQSFPEREEEILEFWKKEEIFEKSLERREGAPLFSFYDGPPFATGLPHYGHILAGTIKDTILRYKVMQGFLVPRRFGWDCHGLPVENEIEKTKALTGASAIEAFGIGPFNEECRSIVLRYTDEWKKTIERLGRWVSFEQVYKTMDPSFMESTWWVFGELYKKGLVYEGFKVMPFSTQLGTPLSNFEANLNYKEVDDPSLVVKFSLEEEPETSLLVWTTTPWTLPSNLAVMMKKDLAYAKIRVKETGESYILAKEGISRYFAPEEIEVVSTCLGEDLIGKKYTPLFSYYATHPNAFRILGEDSVESEEGTGVVHAAPAFGEVDFYACVREGIEPVCPVDQNGKFTDAIQQFAQMYVKDADKEIIRQLKKEKKVFSHGQIRHRYPFCWRSDTPLIYKTVRTWFVAVEKIKDKVLAANEEIHWVPEHVKHGRFGKWLEGARDWAISRNRYWGTPIPIWRSQDGEVRVITSKKELEEKTGATITDLHRHFIDELTFEEEGKLFERIPEVFDCWFESGSMPYAQNHYPFENKEETEKSFPADFIAEGLDQTRGWFYTLTVLSAALFEKPAFKNVIVNGILLAEDGNKMSKRLKNYPEPEVVFDRYGVDAVRLYLLNSPAVAGEDLRFTEKDVEKTARQVLIPFWNSFVFLSTYADICNWKPGGAKSVPKADIDRWALSIAQKLIEEVTKGMDEYQIGSGVAPLVGFVEQLTNWYIRRSRSRFWEEEASEDREEAFTTLHTLLLTLAKVSAPFIPFLSEAIYQEIKGPNDPQSVHLTDFPKVDKEFRLVQLEEEMAFVQAVVSAGHALRKEYKLKVRQPLQRVHLVTAEEKVLEALRRHEHLILEELNVKEVLYHTEESAFVELTARPNFRLLGKKVGKKMQAVQDVISTMPRKERTALFSGLPVSICLEGEEFLLTPEDVVVERRVLEGLAALTVNELTIALDTALSSELIQEGLARELVNRINSMRKEQGFAITDRVQLELSGSLAVEECFAVHGKYILKEVLATSYQFVEGSKIEPFELNGELITIAIRS